MDAGNRYGPDTVPESARRAPSGTDQRWPGHTADEDSQEHPAARRVRAATWLVAAAVLFVLFLRVSLTEGAGSDAANNALQSWDMLHGHLLLHGWIIGDATYYTFDLPMIALAEVFVGLHTIAVHVAVALIYLIVTALAVIFAVTGSGGAARAVRAAVTVAVVSAPLLIISDRWITLGFPDHTGTVVFLLVSCLLIDRAAAWRLTAPLLCVILCAGQIGDVTVRYVTVPAIVIVCAYRAVAARKLRTCDAANLIAAAASVPLALVVRAALLHAGAYLMVSPKSGIAPVAKWPHNWALAWHNVRLLFGAQAAPAQPAGSAVIFGYACLLVAAAGIVGTLLRWRTAGRAEQVLLTVIVVNIGVFAFSTLPGNNTPHDIVAVLPAGAILGARTVVPARIAGRLGALAASAVAMVAALLPLSVVAAQPPAATQWAALASWLQSNGLRYGLGGYWDGSSVTLLSGNQVKVRSVELKNGQVSLDPWETNTLWFDPASEYANFAIVGTDKNDLSPKAEGVFGKPVRTHRVGSWEVLIYNKNLLSQLQPAQLPPTS
jgi:hypothetical protein